MYSSFGGYLWGFVVEKEISSEDKPPFMPGVNSASSLAQPAALTSLYTDRSNAKRESVQETSLIHLDTQTHKNTIHSQTVEYSYHYSTIHTARRSACVTHPSHLGSTRHDTSSSQRSSDLVLSEDDTAANHFVDIRARDR